MEMPNAAFIMHSISSNEHRLFHTDGVHLSNLGFDLLINDFILALGNLASRQNE
jgi:hypothetical protein